MKGVEKNKKDCLRITDRWEAISAGINMAKKNDIILIAGKGHEIWQSVKGANYPFDEKLIIHQLVERN